MARICMLLTVARWAEMRNFYKQAPALARDGHEVIFMADDPGRKVTDLFTIHVLSDRQRRMAKFTGSLHLLPLILRLRPAVLQVCCLEQVPLGLALKVVSRIKVVYDSREDMYHSIRDRPTRFPRWLQWIAAQCTRVIEHLAARTFDGIIASDPAIFKIHRAMPDERKTLFFNTALLSQFTRDYLPLSDRPYDLVWLGVTMRPDLGFGVFVEALRILTRRGQRFRMLLIGDVKLPERAVLDRTAEELEISGNITITGYIPYADVPAVVRQGKIGLVLLPDMPKLRNNISCKAFEYMASGMPVISSDLPPQRLFIRHGQNGLFFEPGNAEALVDAMTTLLNDPWRAQDMGEAGRKAVERYWNNEREQEELRRFYRKIIAGPRRGRRMRRPADKI